MIPIRIIRVQALYPDTATLLGGRWVTMPTSQR